MALLIKGLHIEEIIIDYDGKEEQPEPLQPEPIQEEAKKPEPKPKKTATKRKIIDRGKVGALRKAGWSVPKIADEMRCGQNTIYKILKEMGL